jgi:hypothetical protein
MPSDEKIVGEINRAHQLEQEERFEECLNAYLWLHEKTFMKPKTPTERSWVFAVNGWVDFAAKHPPALSALHDVRSKVHQQLTTDPKKFKLLDYLTTLDFALKDYSAAKEVYFFAKKHGLDTSLYKYKLDDILASGDKEWAVDLLGDNPEDKLKKDCFSHQSSWYSLQTSSVFTDENGPDVIYFDYIVRSLTRRIKLYSFAYGNEKGEELTAKMLSWIDSPILREAVQSNLEEND